MFRRAAVLGFLILTLAALMVLIGDHGDRLLHKPNSGFLGLEFAPLTRAAQGRAPWLTHGGALVVKVVPDSPAAAARLTTGEIVTSIDNEAISSASDAAEILSRKKPGAHVSLTYFDLEKGDGHVRMARAVLSAEPPVSKKVYRVEPPRTLAREWDFKPAMAAHASWSNAIARGAVEPLPLKLQARGRCSALAPEDWTSGEVSADGTHFELVSHQARARAIFVATTVPARAKVESAVDQAIARFARITPEAGPAQTTDGGFRVVDFGSMSGYAGFALFHTRPKGMIGLVLSLWIAAVPASNVAELAPIAGAVALSIRCDSKFSESPKPFENTLAPWAVSTRCLKGGCSESDFAGAYNAQMHTGYVHSTKDENFLIDPRKDIWATGPNGPGTYRQVTGTLEKLEPGRTN